MVGTGGAERSPFGKIEAHSEARDANTPEVLKLTLKPDSYDWEFVPVAGETFIDSGTDGCTSGGWLPRGVHVPAAGTSMLSLTSRGIHEPPGDQR